MLVSVDFIEWKRFITAHKERGDVGPFKRENITVGDDSFVRFMHDGQAVALMTVYGSNTDAMAHDCKRKFEIEKWLLDAVQHIYIPDPDWLDSIEDAYEDRGAWEDNANWKVYKRSVEEGRPDPGWIPEGFPQELIDAYHDG